MKNSWRDRGRYAELFELQAAIDSGSKYRHPRANVHLPGRDGFPLSRVGAH